MTAYLAAASRAGKSRNQDRVATFDGRTLRGVAVADGVGSSLDADLAAEAAVASFVGGLGDLDGRRKPVARREIAALWERVRRALCDLPREGVSAGAPAALQTTLLTVVDTGDRYLVSYVGNGSVLYIRGDFWRFWDRRWPWVVTDLVTPDCALDPETGKDMLTRVAEPSAAALPFTLIERQKDRETGEVVAVCTDGVGSLEQARVGLDAGRKLWMEVNPHVEALVNTHLREYLSQVEQGRARDEALSGALDGFLDGRTFEDDASLALIVSARSVEHYLAGRTELTG